MDRETVAAALAMAKVGACDAAEQRTLAELCRQLRGLLTGLVAGESEIETAIMSDGAYHKCECKLCNDSRALLALWPDDAEEVEG